MLTLLIEAYTEDEAPSARGGMEKRTVMKLHPRLVPYDCAVLPLSKHDKLIAKAREVYEMLLQKTSLNIEFDVTGSIGKRYRRQDEIGTPQCITVDFGTIGEDEKQCKEDHVTIRDRDTLKQEEVPIGSLRTRLAV
jgi:glycyl-tRNA synthetase